MVANSTLLPQEPSQRLPRNLSVNSLTVRYANKPSHLAISFLGHTSKTDLSHHYEAELKKKKKSCVIHPCINVRIILRVRSKICTAELLSEGQSASFGSQTKISGPKPFTKFWWLTSFGSDTVIQVAVSLHS